MIILLTLITTFEILLILSHIVHFDHSAHLGHNIWKSAHSFPPCPTKVEEEDPADLEPKIGAEKMTRRLCRGYQFDL